MSLTDELDQTMASGVDLRAMLDPAASDEVRRIMQICNACNRGNESQNTECQRFALIGAQKQQGPAGRNKALEHIEKKYGIAQARTEDAFNVGCAGVPAAHFQDVNALSARYQNRKTDRSQQITDDQDEQYNWNQHGVERFAG